MSQYQPGSGKRLAAAWRAMDQLEAQAQPRVHRRRTWRLAGLLLLAAALILLCAVAAVV